SVNHPSSCASPSPPPPPAAVPGHGRGACGPPTGSPPTAAPAPARTHPAAFLAIAGPPKSGLPGRARPGEQFGPQRRGLLQQLRQGEEIVIHPPLRLALPGALPEVPLHFAVVLRVPTRLVAEVRHPIVGGLGRPGLRLDDVPLVPGQDRLHVPGRQRGEVALPQPLPPPPEPIPVGGDAQGIAARELPVPAVAAVVGLLGRLPGGQPLQALQAVAGCCAHGGASPVGCPASSGAGPAPAPRRPSSSSRRRLSSFWSMTRIPYSQNDRAAPSLTWSLSAFSSALSVSVASDRPSASRADAWSMMPRRSSSSLARNFGWVFQR